MIKKRFRVFHGTQHMPWATGTAVRGAGGFVFLSGTAGTDPDTNIVVEGMAAQAKLSMMKIKERLEEFGTSLDNICHLWYYVKGPEFPEGVHNDPKWIEASKAIDEFWHESGYPDFVSKKNPLPSTLLGISSLAQKEMLIEITAIAALPPRES
jgi:enamine deaminase RidA (YjgF/YER057c/UK114 family)